MLMSLIKTRQEHCMYTVIHIFFRCSEKAIRFEKMSQFYITFIASSKRVWKFFQIHVAFSEFLNFIYLMKKQFRVPRFELGTTHKRCQDFFSDFVTVPLPKQAFSNFHEQTLRNFDPSSWPLQITDVLYEFTPK